ncbi:class I SAM-dependent methyltransferase [Variovorax sp. PCZ-1]|uniref:class I SAM-dependent methyltransferase n=1 Tax=Variovorax sp. PCZ-1 TaxID=2835533 RepID=UPI001BD06D5D|nr:class I SAM-dependent methyltransferase [Variovorax sp. PCZ-1]MBS7808762.1 class I SAM-dependent methyltransferase [Variovorax sp. PCZ-1]
MAASHLDLGCGQRPKNPYGHPRLFGVDIRSGLQIEGVERIEAANLSSQPIPFGDNQFDSVSAYDFLEHVPRVSLDAQGDTQFPFIKLIDEIWRVLKPGGMLYAITPAYPHEKAFRDPTHVNIITAKTHRYFTLPKLEARMYGFAGTFELKRQVRLHPRGAYEPEGASRAMLRVLDGLAGKRSHLLWELKAIKETASHG